MEKLRLDNVDIRSILDDIGISYDEHGKNVSRGWIGVQCPFCDDSSNHLGINLDHLTISCFSCGTSGTVLKYLSQELRSFKDAKQILEKAIPRELRRTLDFEQSIVTKCELPKGATKKYTKAHKKYLESRGFNIKKLTKRYDLYFTTDKTDKAKWENRIIVPIKRRNRLVTFTTISILKNPYVRYLHCPDEESIIPIKSLLIGEDLITDKNKVKVVEGIFDLFRIGIGCVATLGTKVTPEQIYLLSKYQKVVIIFDGDKAGRKGTAHLSSNLSALTQVAIIDLPEGIDPDKLDNKSILFIRNY